MSIEDQISSFLDTVSLDHEVRASLKRVLPLVLAQDISAWAIATISKDGKEIGTGFHRGRHHYTLLGAVEDLKLKIANAPTLEES